MARRAWRGILIPAPYFRNSLGFKALLAMHPSSPAAPGRSIPVPGYSGGDIFALQLIGQDGVKPTFYTLLDPKSVKGRFDPLRKSCAQKVGLTPSYFTVLMTRMGRMMLGMPLN